MCGKNAASARQVKNRDIPVSGGLELAQSRLRGTPGGIRLFGDFLRSAPLDIIGFPPPANPVFRRICGWRNSGRNFIHMNFSPGGCRNIWRRKGDSGSRKLHANHKRGGSAGRKLLGRRRRRRSGLQNSLRFLVFQGFHDLLHAHDTLDSLQPFCFHAPLIFPRRSFHKCN